MHIHNLLSPDECDYLIQEGNKTIERSTVVGNNGTSVRSAIRTSKGTFLERWYDAVVIRIEQRVASVTMIPFENQEDLQILNYQKGEKYSLHPDYFEESYQTVDDGLQRVTTVLMYLTNVTQGGETIFPYGKWNSRNYDFKNNKVERQKENDRISDCAKSKLHVLPNRGDAVMFFDLSTGTDDNRICLNDDFSSDVDLLLPIEIIYIVSLSIT